MMFLKTTWFELSVKTSPLEIWLPFSMGARLEEWVEWLLAFLSWSCRDGEVGADPLSSLPGRLILELNPRKDIERKHVTYRMLYVTDTRYTKTIRYIISSNPLWGTGTSQSTEKDWIYWQTYTLLTVFISLLSCFSFQHLSFSHKSDFLPFIHPVC